MGESMLQRRFPLFFVRMDAMRGFTLMELLLVMVLLSGVVLLFVSYTGDIGNVAADAASRKVESDIRYAKQLATTTETVHGVLFVPGEGYTVYRGDESQPVDDPLDRQPMVEDLSEFGDIVVGNTYRVEFDKFGAPVVGGGGDITVLADNGASRRIYVAQNTGATVVDVLDQGSGCSCRLCMEDNGGAQFEGR